MRIKLSFSAAVLAAAAVGIVVAGRTSPAYALPTSMSCPQLMTYSFGTCTLRASPNETLWVTSSNTAIAVSAFGGTPAFGQTGVSIQADASGNGRVSIRSFGQKGQVTICAYDISRSSRSCSITRVN